MGLAEHCVIAAIIRDGVMTLPRGDSKLQENDEIIAVASTEGTHKLAELLAHPRRIVGRYVDYYHNWRTHLSLSMDAPNPRTVHPPDRGRVVAFPELDGLHHHYERWAA